LSSEAAPLNTTTLTSAPETPSGRILGTPAYMSPEQIRAEKIDHRSDIFSFGAVLYEMLCGKRAFVGSSPVETMNMVLQAEPPPLDPPVTPALASMVRRCLEKKREDRFDSARDLGFSLTAIGDSLSFGSRGALMPLPSRRRFLVSAGTAVPAIAAGIILGRATLRTEQPRFHRLSFGRGTVSAARFANDGRTILYAAAWDGQPNQIYSVRPESPESSVVGFPGATLLGLSPSGQLALCLGYHYVSGFIYSGMLARVPLGGGAPREVLTNVEWADWSPDGRDLAIVRHVNGYCRLEFPAGKVLYETGGWVSNVRFSPGGDKIGFLDHPTDGNNGGVLAILDPTGKKRIASGEFEAEEGLAWSRKNEVWFTAARRGANLNLHAATDRSKERVLARIPGWNTVADVSAIGEALLIHGSMRFELLAFGPEQSGDRNLSWHDWSLSRDISSDGKLVLFDETGEGGGENLGVYIRKTDGSPAVRLGDGLGMSLSPDGKWALTLPVAGSPEVVLVPTGPGEPKHLPLPTHLSTAGAQWFPDGKRLLLAASELGHGVRLYEMQLAADLSATRPRPFSEEGVTRNWRAISPNGRFVIAANIDGSVYVHDTVDGSAERAPGVLEGELPIAWSDDPKYFYILSRTEFPAKIYKIGFVNGSRQLWKEISPPDPTGVRSISGVRISPNGKWYSYSIETLLTDLYLVDGLS
ncbi:MAG: protein kinase, partial [Acidobacteriaceae bacterium]|nr:protein kinase [Acidobacteriaceae bacterium]